MAYANDPVPTNNEERAAQKAEEIADAKILEMAEEDATQTLEEQYQDKWSWQVENSLDDFRSNFWDGFYEEAYEKALAELNTPKFNNRAHKFFEME